MSEEKRYWSFTCPKCSYVGDKEADWDWQYACDKQKWVEVSRLPDRCSTCKAALKRYSRSRRSLQRLLEYSEEKHGKPMIPKMLTVSLVSQWNDERSRSEQLEELKKKWRKLRPVLNHRAGIDAGYSVPECTEKWGIGDTSHPEFPFVPAKVKYHAHIHAAVCTPFMKKDEFVEFCQTAGKSVGLGALNIVADRSRTTVRKKLSHLANYLSKYLSKSNDTGNPSPFGKLIGYRSPSERDAKDSTSS